jgi:hypothetical protein
VRATCSPRSARASRSPGRCMFGAFVTSASFYSELGKIGAGASKQVRAGLRTASRLVEPDLGAQHVLKILQLVERVAIEGLCEAHCKQGSDDSEKIEQPR